MWLIFVSSVVKRSISTYMCIYVCQLLELFWLLVLIKKWVATKKQKTESVMFMYTLLQSFKTHYMRQIHISISICLLTFEIALSKSKGGFNIHTSIALKSLGTLHSGFGYLRVFCCVYNLYYNAAKYSWVTEEITIILLLLTKNCKGVINVCGEMVYPVSKSY